MTVTICHDARSADLLIPAGLNIFKRSLIFEEAVMLLISRFKYVYRGYAT